ncbi:hypothetical protein L226DRAFT_470707 [Lentinus tigrinus ALCF2SS1-7]|uniref:Uncharacterized protein n=1 Tax=Lentinus tigrinus ALCF2SS1-6 TaxID=1328759 RepID=A0A5C2RW15_9APHY|nr:hypothetical protein L227DRAFT_510406 [Lentinus tigrinus ALCF2SS1-6]RPD70179.1 hypothetical protein L226DRAFT_470707 [Lentinus tigrinus ALCF2SS1-7]
MRENRALRKRVERRDARLLETTKEAGEEEHSVVPYKLKGRGGVIPDSVRALVRELIILGLKVHQVGGTISAVAGALGVPIEGSISKRSIGRFMTEMWVAEKMQIAEGIHKAESLTLSGDGTAIRNIDHIARNVYLNNGDSHQRLSFGVHSASNHTSEKQLQGWDALTEDYFRTYNASPRGQQSPADPRSFAVKSAGTMADHAEDQKKFARLWEARKKTVDRELRGERALEDLLMVISEETLRAVEAAGGNEVWATLNATALDAQSAAIMRSSIMRVGEDAYQALSDEEKADADLFVRGGCCMHKDLNAVKGVHAGLQAFWARTGHAPILLMNRDNDAAATSTDPLTSQRAAERSVGGAIKLAELAGAIFRHKDDKKGQHDSWRYFCETHLGYAITFPNTSSTRFGSYVEAAAELIVHRDLYLEFLELVHDKKDSRSFNHMENNVYRGLKDYPTLTELCVLALYGQVVSKPYMRQVRRGGLTNHWDLGPLHDGVKTLLRTFIQNPHLLLTPDLSSGDGALDGRPCERPEVFAAVQKLAPTLPWLRDALMDGLKGGLETWERFTTEFAPGAPALSAKARGKAWMKPTNDDNEGGLGTRRVRKRICPSMSEHQHNAREMGKVNNTLAYMKDFTEAELGFTRTEGRRLGASCLEKRRHEEIVQDDEEQVNRKRQKDEEKAAALSEKHRELLKLDPILDPEDPRLNDKLTIKELDAHLEWHREFHDTRPRGEKNIPMKSLLKLKNEKLNALIEAAARYRMDPLPMLPTPQGQA